MENSKNSEFRKSEKYAILKISKIFHIFPNSKIPEFENHRISEIVQFRKIADFKNFTISKTQNSMNFQFNELSYSLLNGKFLRHEI